MAESSIRVFRVSPEGLARLHEDWLTRMRQRWFVPPIFILAFLYITNPSASVWVYILLGIGGVLLGYLTPHLTLAQLRERFAAFEVHVGPDSLVRKQHGFPDWTILRSDVRGIVEGSFPGIFIRTVDFHRSLFIPRHVEGFEELRAILGQWAGPVSAMSQRFFQFAMTGGAMLTFFAHMAPQWITDPVLLISAHVLAAAAAAWLLYEIQRSPDMTDQMRKYSWCMLLWVAFELRAAWRIFESSGFGS